MKVIIVGTPKEVGAGKIAALKEKLGSDLMVITADEARETSIFDESRKKELERSLPMPLAEPKYIPNVEMSRKERRANERKIKKLRSKQSNKS
jgi:hypothetical protein